MADIVATTIRLPKETYADLKNMSSIVRISMAKIMVAAVDKEVSQFKKQLENEGYPCSACGNKVRRKLKDK